MGNFFFILFTFMSSVSWPHSVERPSSPQFTFEIGDNVSGLKESDVQYLFEILESEFQIDIQDERLPLSGRFDWANSYVGAGSSFHEGHFNVMLWGGLVRARFMNFGVLSAIVCHELGHRLGGTPHQIFDNKEDWSSSEGQADHFSATVCLPKVYEALVKNDTQEFLTQEVEPAAIPLCQSSRQSTACRWVATSGIDLIQTLQVYYDLDQPFADPFASPTEKVESTLTTAYPSYQCRMEIYKTGASCSKGLQCPRLPCWFKD